VRGDAHAAQVHLKASAPTGRKLSRRAGNKKLTAARVSPSILYTTVWTLIIIVCWGVVVWR